jgi:hypothetical protein
LLALSVYFIVIFKHKDCNSLFELSENLAFLRLVTLV